MDFDKENVYGLSLDGSFDMKVMCPDCNEHLTTIALTGKGVIDISVKCKKCGGTAVGHNLWIEPV